MVRGIQKGAMTYDHRAYSMVQRHMTIRGHTKRRGIQKGGNDHRAYRAYKKKALTIKKKAMTIKKVGAMTIGAYKKKALTIKKYKKKAMTIKKVGAMTIGAACLGDKGWDL
ncbi:hypothetical protein NC652_029050 [Populus alba x Populus x berolinensis]|nr:hypothetical protein NC652_029050 [Populus alba x Populus x berolinensis]